jgi:hypothetical protein
VACGGASFVTTVVRRISVPPNSFALILTKGQEETNRLYWENSRKHESTRRERKLPPGPRRKPIAAGHAFVDVLLCRNFGLRYLRACTPYTWPSRRRRSVGTVEFTGSLFGRDLYGSHLDCSIDPLAADKVPSRFDSGALDDVPGSMAYPES